GMAASKTVLPVFGVPVESKALKGLDSLLSIAQMPGGIPVGTLAIGKAGAINAALLAAASLGNKYPKIREALRKFRASQTKKVLAVRNPAKFAAISIRKKRKRKRPSEFLAAASWGTCSHSPVLSWIFISVLSIHLRRPLWPGLRR